MDIQRNQFPSILHDNDEVYFSFLEGVINAVDPLSNMMVTKTVTKYVFRLCPSEAIHTNTLIEEINKINNLFSIRAEFSKSIKTSAVLNWTINI